MKKAYRLAVLCLFAFSLSGEVHAQTTAQTPSTLVPAQSAATQIDPKNLAAAQELVKAFDMNALMQSVFGVISKTLLPLVLRDNPNQTQQVQQMAVDAVQKSFMSHMDELSANKAVVYAQM